MAIIEVTTQAALDKALASAKPSDIIAIRGAGAFSLRGSAGAYGSATVTAYGSATVTASGSATVTASGSATVTAYGSATVRAYGSATVTAYGSATVRASGSATVTASGSATVTASGSATVRASGSATVTASDSATVTAYGSATVTASGSATVRAGKYVAVHLDRNAYGKPSVAGGVLIEVPKITKASDVVDYLGVTFDPPLGSVKKEEAAARAAWAAAPDATIGIHVHHSGDIFEALSEPVGNRIAYIVAGKPLREQAIRLRLMRPALDLPTDWQGLPAAKLEALHDERCPGCPWDGRSIFQGLS